MPANRNALVRYKTIDSCLQNHYRQWTLEDLIEKCSEVLNEYEGIRKGISRRSIQMDIQMMRSEKLGYNAPIVVYDNKYYKYADPHYSITNMPLNESDLQVMTGAVEVLRQFKGFAYFAAMNGIVSRLEDCVTSAHRKTKPVIDFEKNEDLKGLQFLDMLYHSIIDKQTLKIKYRSFKAHSPQRIIFYPYLLKEYRNRWFVFGMKKHNGQLYNLALDRILQVSDASNELFVDNELFDPETFFDDVLGVTKKPYQRPEAVRFYVNADEMPYIATKPIHKSQKQIQQNIDGSAVFQLEVIVNVELERDLLAYADGIRILSPQHLVDTVIKKMKKTVENYDR
jgi:predicted DNA-binding transcriptional regulator YafY